MTPESIGRYRILRRIGAGGMGIVYEAIDARNERRIALKVLLPHAAEEREGLLRFKREFRAQSRLRHPNIVEVFDAGIEEDVPFIAMELVVGKDIRRHINALPEGPLRDLELRRCTSQILGALAHVHARRIVHRDLKPENILVCEDGRVKLMDFGVARGRQTEEGDSGLLGTFAYMSPEQVKGEEMDGRSDLYAVGVLIYELMTGDYPFPVEPPAAALHHHVHTLPEPVLSLRPRADPRLAELSARLLEKAPEDRIQSAEAAFALLASSGDEPLDPGAPGMLFSPRLVGRELELARLQERLEDLGRGSGSVLVLEGPAGIGKSRLATGFVRRMGPGYLVLKGQCAPEQGPAYAPIEGILQDVARIAERANPEVAARVLGPDARVLAPLCERLGRLAGAGDGELPLDDGPVDLRKAIIGILGRLALVRPLVILLEDIHWADAASLSLLRGLGKTLFARRPGANPALTVSPIFFLMTRRSLEGETDRVEELLRKLEPTGRLERIRLAPLSEEAVAHMLASMTGQPDLGAPVSEELFRITRGRPLLVRETVEAWLREGLLHRESGRWTFGATVDDPSGELTTPRSRRPRPARGDEVALSRLDRASTEARDLVERLALLGRVIPGELLARVSGLEEDPLLDAVDEMVRARLLMEDVRGSSVGYRFHHEGFREAVARSLPPARKRALHDDIAARLERRPRGRRRERAQVLARHFKASEHPPRAVRYIIETAREADRRGDPAGARRRFSEAFEILESVPRSSASVSRIVKARCAEADVLIGAGFPEQALERADPELAFEARSPTVSEAELRLRRAEALYRLGRGAEALLEVERVPRPWPTASVGARVSLFEAHTARMVGEGARSTRALEEAVRLVDAVGEPHLSGRVEVWVSALRTGARQDEGRLEEWAAWARRTGDLELRIEAIGVLGISKACKGDCGGADAELLRAVELAEARGHREGLVRWTARLGRWLLDQGQLDGAQRSLNRALELAESARDQPRQWRARIDLARWAVARGQADAAQAWLGAGLRPASEAGYRALEGWGRLAEAELALARGDLSRAGAAWREAKDQGSSAGDAELELWAAWALLHHAGEGSDEALEARGRKLGRAGWLEVASSASRN